MLGFVAVRLSVSYVGLCGCATVSLIYWALWPCGCQSDMFGFVSRAAVSLICLALLAVRLSV